MFLKSFIIGHTHGTLWVKLEKLEKLVMGNEGKLVNGSSEQLKDDQVEKPLKGLKEAFVKLRNNMDLNENEVKALIKMVDEFTTVSLHEKTVGKDVVKIAKEVNVHHHTRTCKKYNQTCRFNYPRSPFHETIIAQPLKVTKDEKDKLLKKQDEVLSKMMKVLDDEKVLENIMKDFKKEEESKEEHAKFVKESSSMSLF